MTPSLADTSHAETCAGRWCNVMGLRSEMHRVEGKRGWFCPRCYANVVRMARNLESLETPDLLEELRKKLRT